jgi:hypothetical protein
MGEKELQQSCSIGPCSVGEAIDFLVASGVRYEASEGTLGQAVVEGVMKGARSKADLKTGLWTVMDAW